MKLLQELKLVGRLCPQESPVLAGISDQFYFAIDKI